MTDATDDYSSLPGGILLVGVIVSWSWFVDSLGLHVLGHALSQAARDVRVSAELAVDGEVVEAEETVDVWPRGRRQQ